MTAEAPPAPAQSYGRLVPVTVHFDDLDALGLLHNARYPVMVERAWTALWNERGFAASRATGRRPATSATRSRNCGSATTPRSTAPARTPCTSGWSGSATPD